MAADKVYSFLQEQNRPFSANDVLQNVGKDHGKGQIQKALDKLVSQNKIIEKTYGKQKIYCVAQNDTTDSNEMDENLKKMDRDINEKTVKLKEQEELLQKNVNELKAFEKKITTEEAKTQVKDLKKEVSNLKDRLSELEENSVTISDEEKKHIYTQHAKYVKDYKSRKRICMDMLNSIMEGYPKTKKHLFEEIGIETDEEVNFKLEV